MIILSYALDIVPKIKAMSEERWDVHTKVLLPIQKLQVIQHNLGNSNRKGGPCKAVYSMCLFQDIFLMQHQTCS